MKVDVVGGGMRVDVVDGQLRVDLAAAKGSQGPNGWAAVTRIVVVDDRNVQLVVDWVGGQGAKPPTGVYVGEDGLVSNPAQAAEVEVETTDIDDGFF